MLDDIRPLYDHPLHKLGVSGCDTPLDILVFGDKEGGAT